MTSQPDEWDPQLDELGSELRQDVGEEFRREAEEVERLVELQRLRKRSLSEAATEIMARGDLVLVETAGQTFKGRITASHRDLLTLDTAAGEVDVNLAGALTLRILERKHRGGLDVTSGSRSFRARLSEYEQTSEALTLILYPSSRMSGRIRVVASDHVVVTDDTPRDCYLPLGTIAAVIRDRANRRPAAPDEL